MIREIADTMIGYSPYALIPPLITGILYYRKAPKSIRTIILLVMVSSITTLASAILWHRKVNNLPLLHLYTVLEFFFLSLFYMVVLPPALKKRIVLAVCIVFVLFALTNSLCFQSIISHNSYTRGLEAFLIILYSLLFYYRMYSHPGEEDIGRSPYFFINTGYFIYFSASFFLFILSNRLSVSVELRHIFWGIHAVFMGVLYSFLTIAFCKLK